MGVWAPPADPLLPKSMTGGFSGQEAGGPEMTKNSTRSQPGSSAVQGAGAAGVSRTTATLCGCTLDVPLTSLPPPGLYEATETRDSVRGQTIVGGALEGWGALGSEFRPPPALRGSMLRLHPIKPRFLALSK